jgi:hypothetical protein
MPNAEWRMLNGEWLPERATSSFELVELIDAGRSIMSVNGEHERESNGGFRGGDRDGKDRDHHASR